MDRTQKAPGLKKVRRSDGVDLYWACSAVARKSGYPIKTVKLKSYAGDPEAILRECRRLHGEMLEWLRGEERGREAYDGTVGGLMRLYQTDPESPFWKMKPASLRPYRFYGAKIDKTIGEVPVASTIGKDVKRWFVAWSSNGEKPAAGHFALNVLKAALSWGAMCGHLECGHLREVIKLLRLDHPKPRQGVFSAGQVVALRQAAHAAGRPSLALASAIQFECSLRLWDVIGQWVPLDAADLSAVTDGKRKWRGLLWTDIAHDNVLRLMPAKTEKTSEARVAIDLGLCPMALEEISMVQKSDRMGPIVIREDTGLPYDAQSYRVIWRRIATAAGIPKALWARDLRASGITEARQGGATIADAAKVAGHTKWRTTAQVYDRDRLEAARRFSRARVAGRNRPETES